MHQLAYGKRVNIRSRTLERTHIRSKHIDRVLRHRAKKKKERVNEKKDSSEMVSATHRRCATGPSQGEVDTTVLIRPYVPTT